MAKIKKIGSGGMIVTDTTEVTVSNTNEEVVLFEQSLSSGSLSDSRALKAELKCRLTSQLLPPNLTIKAKLGDSEITIVNGLEISPNISAKPFTIEVLIANKGKANAQYVYGKITQLGSVSAIYDNDADWKENTTIDRTFQITAQFSSLVGTTTLTMKHAESSIA